MIIRKMIKLLLNQKGQNILELVLGLGLIAAVAVAISVITVNSLQNSQFSKNQTQATKLAQEIIEKVRTTKNSNFGICTQSQVAQGSTAVCSNWEQMWANEFGTFETNCETNQTCTYGLCSTDQPCAATFGVSCLTAVGTGSETQPFCIKHSPGALDLGDGFTGQVFIEDEQASQKRVTVRVYWTDSAGQHMSELVTILSRL